ncbi:MAG: STAS domain-containing protein [Pseudomonadota bacterium]
MKIESRLQDDVLILSIQETRIDASGAVAFKERMRGLLAGHDGRVVLDLGQVEFLDSSGLGALVAVMKMLGGRKLELARCGPVVSKVLALTRMNSVFVMHDGLAAVTGDPDQDAA